MDNNFDPKRYASVRQRFCNEFDFSVSDDVVSVMCANALDMVEELLDEYTSCINKIRSLIDFYNAINDEE